MPPSASKSGTPFWKKLALASAAPIVFLSGLELALWLARFEYRRAQAPILIWNPVEDRRLEEGRGLHVSDAAQLWKPRPGARVEWGEDERINSAGFRGPLLSREKSAGVLRIATLGDSSTFGMGVPYPDCYTARLPELLAELGRAAEVMDCGVIGYTVRQGLERYRALVRPYKPDVVVAAFGAVNEHFPALGLADRQKIARSKGASGALVEFLPRTRVVQFSTWLLHLARGLGRDQNRAEARRVAAEHDRQRQAGSASWRGQRRVPFDDFDLVLTTLGREVAADGGRLVLIVMPRQPAAETAMPVLVQYSERVREVAQREGHPVLDARELFQERFRAGVPPAELFAGDWWHPNAAGHEIIARGLAPLVLAASAQGD